MHSKITPESSYLKPILYAGLMLPHVMGNFFHNMLFCSNQQATADENFLAMQL